MSSQPTSGTSRVIESLQATIDNLKNELNETKVNLNETKQKHTILQKRNENMVEQLSNAKYQAEVAESMLKRKERRILDLETQLTDSISSYDTMKFDLEKLKSDISIINSDKVHITAEKERLDMAYEMLENSFSQYRTQMNQKVDELKSQVPNFIEKREKCLNENINLLKTQQPEITSSYNLLIKNSKRLEELYSQKYQKVNDSLLLLANSTKQHGEATSIIMAECEDILKNLNRNEDVMLKIINETNGNLTNEEKMQEFTKLRDISILVDSTNINNSTSLRKSPKNGHSNDSRITSPGLLDSKFANDHVLENPRTRKARSATPIDTQDENTVVSAIHKSNDTRGHHRKRSSINIPKKDRRKRSSNRQSMQGDDFNGFSRQSSYGEDIKSSDGSRKSGRNNRNTSNNNKRMSSLHFDN
ncbi:hypothetical protein DAMA08_035230 [Martiniozyma asiatica (nom. inval.)]|nr:hypothetical protein DAMA08_035230 [Martiniozyma asiatica]